MSEIHIATVRECGPERPRSDTASVVRLADGRLLCAYHSYLPSDDAGGDFGFAQIYVAESADEGATWGGEHVVAEPVEGDVNIMCPSLCVFGDELLVLYTINHERTVSSTVIRRSVDGGRTFSKPQPIFDRIPEHRFFSYDGLLLLADGSLLSSFTTSPHVWNAEEHFDVGTVSSSDGGLTREEREHRIDLPMRGAMEPSIAELADGDLVMSLRTQLGSAFVCRSHDRGRTWTLPQTTGLVAPESCTCLRRVPDTRRLVLFYNGAPYEPEHHHYGMRTPLSAATSDDGGETWRHLIDLAADPEKEYTNLSCAFFDGPTPFAVLTFLESLNAPGREFGRTCMSLRAALIPVEVLAPH